MLKTLKAKYLNKETGKTLLKEGKGIIVEEIKSTVIGFIVGLVLKALILFALIGAVIYGYNYIVDKAVQVVKTEVVDSTKETYKNGKAELSLIVEKVNKDKEKFSDMANSIKEKSSLILEEQKEKVNKVIEKELGGKNETK